MRDTRRALAVAVTTAFRADPWRSAGVVILSCFASIGAVSGAYWLRRIVDSVAAHNQAGTMSGAIGLGVTAGLTLLAGALTTRMQFPLKENTGLYLDHRIVTLVAGIATIEHHERPAYLDRLDVLRREMPVLGFAGIQTAGALALVVQTTATGILLASLNPLLLTLPLFAIPSLWAGGKAERIRQAALDSTADRSRRARHFFELATSPGAGKELRIFGVGEELRRRHADDWAEVDRLLDVAARRGLVWAAVGWAIFSAGYGAAIALVVGQAVAGTASAGDVVLALALVAQVNGQVGAAVSIVSEAVRTVEVADRYLWLCDYAAASRIGVDDPQPAPDTMAEGISLRGVAFRYPETDVDVLAGVDLWLPAGATVAVVGDNGAGKSTLVKLLCRFYEPSQGSITVDGIDLRRIDVIGWRQRISAGFQDFTRFELRAGQAIGIGDLPFMDKPAAVATALDRAASAEIVATLPEGLDTQLGASFDSGIDLSGGQWQKLALARAMMRPAPLLLVLDEPTAALDAETEHSLFARYASAAAVSAAGNGAITVLVSHRFSTVRMADIIVVVDGGGIAGVGSHEELMVAGGLYSELYELQARGYR